MAALRSHFGSSLVFLHFAVSGHFVLQYNECYTGKGGVFGRLSPVWIRLPFTKILSRCAGSGFHTGGTSCIIPKPSGTLDHEYSELDR